MHPIEELGSLLQFGTSQLRMVLLSPVFEDPFGLNSGLAIRMLNLSQQPALIHLVQLNLAE